MCKVAVFVISMSNSVLFILYLYFYAGLHADSDTRLAVQEQLRLGQQLKRKMGQMSGVDNEDDDGVEDEVYGVAMVK